MAKTTATRGFNILSAEGASKSIPHVNRVNLIPRTRKAGKGYRWVAELPAPKPVKTYFDKSVIWTPEERIHAEATAEKPPVIYTRDFVGAWQTRHEVRMMRLQRRHGDVEG